MIKKIFYLSLLCLSPFACYSETSSFQKDSCIEASGESCVAEKVKQTKEILAQFARADEDVLSQYDAFCTDLQKGMEEGKINERGVFLVLDSLAFAAEKHKDQVRSNAKKTPYIIHPIEVADLVMKVGGSYEEEVLIAALLHDVIEDTNTTFEELAKRYGKTVSNYVKEMTDPKELSLKERKKLQIIKAFHQTPGAAVIKMSDKLSNLRILANNPPSNWSRDRIDQYFQWAQSVIENLPDANPSLKSAVKKVIAEYWEKQEKKK